MNDPIIYVENKEYFFFISAYMKYSTLWKLLFILCTKSIYLYKHLCMEF